jgi:hypothetical protein
MEIRMKLDAIVSSKPRLVRCGTDTHTVSSKPQDGIMERLIAQDPMIIPAAAAV